MAKKETCESYIGGELIDDAKLTPELRANMAANGGNLYFHYEDTIPQIGDVIKVTEENVKLVQSNARIHSAVKLAKRDALLTKYGKAGAAAPKGSKAARSIVI
jgi:hypothetical protein